MRSGFEAGARDVQVDWSDNAVSRTRMELGSEEALTDSKPYQLRRYLDYAESEGSVCVLHLIADDPEVYAGLDGAKISRVNAANREIYGSLAGVHHERPGAVVHCGHAQRAVGKEGVPGAGHGCRHREALWQLIFDVCRVDRRRPRERVEGTSGPADQSAAIR